MDELEGTENFNAGNAFQKVEKQLCFHGVGRPDKHFGQSAHPTFTYVFSYFYPSIAPERCYIHAIIWIKSSSFIFLTENRIAGGMMKEYSKP